MKYCAVPKLLKQGSPEEQKRRNSTAATQLDKVQEEYIEVADLVGSCCKGTWKQVFEITGGISFYSFTGNIFLK